MHDSSGKDLAYHHSEIARLTAAIAAARPNARSTNALRTKLKHHEDRIVGDERRRARHQDDHQAEPLQGLDGPFPHEFPGDLADPQRHAECHRQQDAAGRQIHREEEERRRHVEQQDPGRLDQGLHRLAEALGL